MYILLVDDVEKLYTINKHTQSQQIVEQIKVIQKLVSP